MSTTFNPSPSDIGFDPETSAVILGDLGFLLGPEDPREPGPGVLLVGLRAKPTLRHYDPEVVDYWASRDGRGVPESISWVAPTTAATEFSWGLIRISDRMNVTNAYLSFGGHMAVSRVGDVLVAVFVSPAPLLRSGGHSQPWDTGSRSLVAYFARLRAAVGDDRALEGVMAAASPLARYAAFVADGIQRFRGSPALRELHGRTRATFQREEQRLRQDHPEDWLAGEQLLAAIRATTPHLVAA